MSSTDITNKNKDVLHQLKLKAQNKNLVNKKDKKLKTKQFTVYVTEDEYIEIEKKSQNDYLGISQYIYKECKQLAIF